MARIRSLAASQLFFLPVMTIISELLFSVGRSILVLVSSRICQCERLRLVFVLNVTFWSKSFRSQIWTEPVKNKSHLLNVSAPFANYVLVKLLEDGNGEREAIFNLWEKENCHETERNSWGTGRGTKTKNGGSYQVSNDFLEKLGTFLHLIFRTSQLDDVALLRRVGEIDNDLEASEMIIIKLNYSWVKTNYWTVMTRRDKAPGHRGRSPRETYLELLWFFLLSVRWLSGETSAQRSDLWCVRFPRNDKTVTKTLSLHVIWLY